MKKILILATLLLSFITCSASMYASTPIYSMSTTGHKVFASQVNLVNQSAYSYTVNATYMDQRGAGRKYVMSLSAYPYAGSSILFPIAFPEYAVYLQVIRDVDGYQTYAGYLSSDAIYIKSNGSASAINIIHQ
jgi:hypothetical protein